MSGPGASRLNLLVAVDKPAGITSHDVVGRMRRAVGERRVGHAGTLDPSATGVLVVGIGQGCRLMSLLTLDTKSYEVGIRLGSRTTTDDGEGDVLKRAAVDEDLTREVRARAEVAALVGDVLQVPPAFSAISVGGRRAYARARAGEEVHLEPRPVSIMAAELLAVTVDGEGVRWDVALTVSKGTYVRSIARDLGESLGCHGHVETLRRTRSGSVDLGRALPLDLIEAGGPAVVEEGCLDPVATLGLPVRHLSEAECLTSSQGKPLATGTVVWPRGDTRVDLGQGDLVCLVAPDGLHGVWELRGERLRCKVNFPQPITGVRP